MNINREELDRLVSNMNEKEIMNLLSILDLYITESSLSEIKDRINRKPIEYEFEWKMIGVAEFKKFVESYVKS